MANPLLTRLQAVRQSGRMALCGYFLAGYPTPDVFFRMVRAAAALDVIEFGIPADEPILDGPVIANAHQLVTRQHGIHAEPALALIGGLHTVHQPRFVMTYTAVGRALDGFLKLCVENNIHGMLAPDIDPVEGAQVAAQTRALGLASITLLDARASDESIQWSIQNGDLIYIKAAPGITGQSTGTEDLYLLLSKIIKRVRAADSSIPIGVGVGIQKPEQIKELAIMGVDMAIVGTKIIEHLAAGEQELVNYIQMLYSATHLN
ncbi:MAG: tryptophan synthase subunit alpha [Anaerolineae bacterium]|nr:tryptophan synthase subunit alpha [Anaerolineae bacterium]